MANFAERFAPAILGSSPTRVAAADDWSAFPIVEERPAAPQGENPFAKYAPSTPPRQPNYFDQCTAATRGGLTGGWKLRSR
jgi:hypothetical protein